MYDHDKGGDEERERFWSALDSVLDRAGNEFRLCIIGNLNG